MNTQDQIGKLILDGGGERDAIHIAIAPVTANVVLVPGQRIGFLKGSLTLVDAVEPFLGVVDPFLPLPVGKGQRFFMFLFPNTITSLKHKWTHPAFATIEIKNKAEKWLRNYAAIHSHYDDPQTAFNNLCDGLREGEVFYHGDDLHSFAELEDPDELKRHAEAYLGIKIDWERFTFSCSC